MEVGSRTSRGFLSVAPEATKTDRKLHDVGRPWGRVRVLAPAEEAETEEGEAGEGTLTPASLWC